MATTDIETEKNKLKWGGFVISAICIVIATFVYWAIVSKWFGDLQSRGQFGDMFGGLTSLFTGLAFAGLIYTILIQRKELQYQREELSLQRKEMARFADAQESSEKALLRQAEYLELSAKVNTLGNLLSQRESIMAYIHSDNKLREEFGAILINASQSFISIGTQLTQVHKET